MSGVVHIPWYATIFRADSFEDALEEIVPTVMHYGAVDYDLFRSREDRYKFLQTATFNEKLDFESYWNSDQLCSWRAKYMGWYQVPILYTWHDHVLKGSLNTVKT